MPNVVHLHPQIGVSHNEGFTRIEACALHTINGNAMCASSKYLKCHFHFVEKKTVMEMQLQSRRATSEAVAVIIGEFVKTQTSRPSLSAVNACCLPYVAAKADSYFEVLRPLLLPLSLPQLLPPPALCRC